MPASLGSSVTLGEFEIIERFFAPLARGEAGALGLTDDACVFDVAPGRSVVVSTDTIIEGRHFLPPEATTDAPRGPDNADAPGEVEAAGADVGAKGFAVGFSDLAAMGADPYGYTLAIALPVSWPTERLNRWLKGFSSELKAQQEAWDVTLLGGDTVGIDGPLTLTLTVFGTVPAGMALRRSTAVPGDLVYVSGTIGDGGLGLLACQGRLDHLDEGHRQALCARYRRPHPRLRLGARLLGLAHAAADVSDGLVADLGHICQASGVTATITTERVPLSAAARAALQADPERLATILEGGDDYELVFTAPAGAHADLLALSARLDLPVTVIGILEPSSSATPHDREHVVRVIDSDGRDIPIAAGGYRHF